MSEREWEVVTTRVFKVDVARMREDFAADLAADEANIEDDEAVVRACWDNGVEEPPYFTSTPYDGEEAWLT